MTWEQFATWKILGKWKWQDAVFATGEIVFLVSTWPMVVGDEKAPPETAFPTTFMLYCFCLVHLSFKLWVTLSLTALTATLWLIIGLQQLGVL